MKTLIALAAFALAASGADNKTKANTEAVNRIREATAVFNEIMGTPDKGIPQDLLEKAHCVVIVPGVKKAAFIIGGKYGKGILTCRNIPKGGWSAPATVRMEGGSVGFQIGAGETDVVMLVMNERGANKLMKSEFTLGGEAEAMAGPVGRSATAQTDAYMRAEILGWSRSRGAFAGISLSGSTLREDKDDNRAIYGRPLTTQEIVTGATVTVPTEAKPLIATLGKYSYREK
jgi:lipid-binding SYLF domain-containing protein